MASRSDYKERAIDLWMKYNIAAHNRGKAIRKALDRARIRYMLHGPTGSDHKYGYRIPLSKSSSLSIVFGTFSPEQEVSSYHDFGPRVAETLLVSKQAESAESTDPKSLLYSGDVLHWKTAASLVSYVRKLQKKLH